MIIFRSYILACGLVLFCTQCAILPQKSRLGLENGLFESAFTGYQIIDLQTRKIIAERNADKYFRPASCTKVLTLYTSLELLQDSLIAYRYTNIGPATSIMQAMGDPTTAHPAFERWAGVQDPRKNKITHISTENWHQNPYGAGWMWDDMYASFSVPMSALTIHGNAVYLEAKNQKWSFEPPFLGLNTILDTMITQPKLSIFEQFIRLPKLGTTRPNIARQEIPLMDPQTIAEQYLGLKKGLLPSNTSLKWTYQRSTPLDTVLRLMVQESDNFLAEQLLLQCAMIATDTLKTQIAIDLAQKRWFSGHATPPNWIDGSGLSSYNLCTPSFQIWLLTELWRKHDHDRILGIFPAGGVSGTLKNWYAAPSGEPPYVFAKTGSMRNVHCLSGYLRTKSGRWIAFSFMHNNFVGSSTAYKQQMQSVFEQLRQR
jgi:serine-type D-Ala-D-Ala carboxypeptidase/endopeptidase (penicillin-binding protein 4)